MKKFGKIIWQDLTVQNAEEVKDFYSKVVGWTSSNVNQGDYNDFNMHTEGDEIVAGVCHKKADISNFPSQWLIYVTIENLDDSLKNCTQMGGKIIDGPKPMGKARYAIIQDPAGAFMALMEE